MASTSAFEFVQGNERLDWGVLVSIDVERLMRSTDVDTLQRIVENIAFSRITRDEAALFTPEHTLHLFHLCQIVLQYLVYSQEMLAKINVKLNDRMTGMQATTQEREALLQRLSDEANLLKKQVKTQRRTLLAYEYNAQAALARGVPSGGTVGGATGPSYLCPYCGEEYHKAESMQSHLRKRHNSAGPTTRATAASAAAEHLPAETAADVRGAPPTSSPHENRVETTRATAAATSAGIVSEEAIALQQLRQRIEQLEKDKEAMERQQRENLILMMLGATRSQTVTTPTPTPQPASSPQLTPPSTGGAAVAPSTEHVPPSPPQSRSPLPGMAPPSATAAAATVVPQSVQGVPVVPDINAMMNYNLSCQRQASEDALRRQLVELEAEIRSLKSSRAATGTPAPVEPAPVARASPPTPSTAAGAAELGSTPAVPRPAWVAELEQAQQRQQRMLQVAPSLSAPPVPTPAPLPPAPSAALPSQMPQPPQHDGTNSTAAPHPTQPPTSPSASLQVSTPPLAPHPAPPPLTSQVVVPLPSIAVPSPYGGPPTPSLPKVEGVAPPPATPTRIADVGAPPPIPTPMLSSSLPAPPAPLSQQPPPQQQPYRTPVMRADNSSSSATSGSNTLPCTSPSKGPVSVPPSLPSTGQPTPLPLPATQPAIPGPASPSTPAPIPSPSAGLGVGSYFAARTTTSLSNPPGAATAMAPPPPPMSTTNNSTSASPYAQWPPSNVPQLHPSSPPSAAPSPSNTTAQPLTFQAYSSTSTIPVPAVLKSTTATTGTGGDIGGAGAPPVPILPYSGISNSSGGVAPAPLQQRPSTAVKVFNYGSSSSSSSGGYEY